MKFDKKFVIYIDDRYVSGTPEDDEVGSAYGKIEIGDFYEHFYMSPQVWSLQEYEQQWQLAWQRIEERGASCFVVNYQRNLVNLWVLYKCKSKIEIHNYLFAGRLFERMVTKPLTVLNSFEITPPYNFDFYEMFPDEKKPKLNRVNNAVSSRLAALLAEEESSDWEVTIL